MTVGRRSPGGLTEAAAERVEEGFRCGRGGIASSACFGSGFFGSVLATFGADAAVVVRSVSFDGGLAAPLAGAEDVACSVCFGCGFAAGVVALDAPVSVDGTVAGAGIVIVGFVAAEAGFDWDCAVAGGSRRTGLSGPPAGAGASAAAEGCAGVVVSGSAARDAGAADSIAAERTSNRMAARR